MKNRFTKIGAGGKRLPKTAKTWLAVHDSVTGLMWDVSESDAMSYKDAIAYAKKVKAASVKGWRLPTVEELFTLADRTKYNPAIDTDYFPNAKSDWYWSSTPAAAFSPSDCAWVVSFGYGSASWRDQYDNAFVRAVRPSQ